MTALLEARQLSAGYGDVAAVRDVDLRVDAGEIVALLGPNGAGKSTTLKTLAGLLRPLAGEVRWNGDVTRAPIQQRVRRGLAYVPEDRSVFMDLSAGENLRVGQGPPARAVELFPELEPLLARKAGLLSGGQQQMVSLARALAADPMMLLADELSLGLAPLVVRRLLEAVRAAAGLGAGVLLVEQNVREALAVADRVYVMQRGRIVLDGTADEIVDQLDVVEQTYLAGPSMAAGAGPSNARLTRDGAE